METKTQPKPPKLSSRELKLLDVGEKVFYSTQKRYQTKRHSDGAWVVRVLRWEGEGPKRKLVPYPEKSFAEKTAAIEYAKSTRPNAVARIAPSGSPTVTDIYRAWEQQRWKRISESTKCERRRRWRLHIEPYWGERIAADVSPRDAGTWLSECEEAVDAEGGKGANQLRETRIDLHSMFREARRVGTVLNNPFADLQAAPVAPRQVTTLRTVHFEPILGASALMALMGDPDRRWSGLPSPWLLQIVSFALLTGLRRGELIALEKQNVDIVAKTIVVSRAVRKDEKNVDDDNTGRGPIVKRASSLPKMFDTSKRHEIEEFRVVPICDQLMHLIELYEMSFDGPGLVWPSETGGMHWESTVQKAYTLYRRRMEEVTLGQRTRWSVINRLITAINEANYELPNVWQKIDFRDLRNSFASFCKTADIHPYAIEKLMGHIGRGTTEKSYDRMTQEDLHIARGKLSNVWAMDMKKLESVLAKCRV